MTSKSREIEVRQIRQASVSEHELYIIQKNPHTAPDPLAYSQIQLYSTVTLQVTMGMLRLDSRLRVVTMNHVWSHVTILSSSQSTLAWYLVC